jgi:hypothetical protein
LAKKFKACTKERGTIIKSNSETSKASQHIPMPSFYQEVQSAVFTTKIDDYDMDN